MSTSKSLEGSFAVEYAGRLAVVAMANAVTVVVLVAYLICALVSIVAPDILIGFFEPWFHGLSLAPLRPADGWFRLDQFVVGLITFGASAWIVSVAVAWLYNRLAER